MNDLVKNFKPWVIIAHRESENLKPGETLFVKHNEHRREWILAIRYFEGDGNDYEGDFAKWRMVMSLGTSDYQARDIVDAGICKDWQSCLSPRTR